MTATDRYDQFMQAYRNLALFPLLEAELYPTRCPQPHFLELLHGLYVLEYANDDLWYDLHPLVTDLLRRKNLLPDLA